jgi:hypothetical protein
MKKSLLLTGAVLALSASVATAEGINLSFNDCGTNGARFATFNCLSNSGTPFPVVASFIPPAGLSEFLGLNAQVDVTTPQPVLPQWWQHGATSCRGTTGLSVSFDFTSSSGLCADFFVGQAAGGFLWESGFGSPNRARMRVTCAVPFDNRGPVDENTEYYAFRITMQRTKSTGTGSCAGCTEQACMVLNEIQLFQPPGVDGGDPILTNPAPENHVTWQSSTVPDCPLSTPAQNRSWGQVKTLYR